MTQLIQPSPGHAVDSYCAPCRSMRPHTIESVVKGKIGRTHCNTCGAQHAYRKTQPGTAKRKGATPAWWAKQSVPVVVDYPSLLVGRDLTKARPYKMSDRFQLKDIIDHSTFGLGVVLAVRDTVKIDIGFADGLKTLAHCYTA